MGEERYFRMLGSFASLFDDGANSNNIFFSAGNDCWPVHRWRSCSDIGSTIAVFGLDISVVKLNVNWCNGLVARTKRYADTICC